MAGAIVPPPSRRVSFTVTGVLSVLRIAIPVDYEDPMPQSRCSLLPLPCSQTLGSFCHGSSRGATGVSPENPWP